MGLLPEAVQPVESPAAEEQPAGLPEAEEQVPSAKPLPGQPAELVAAEAELGRKYRDAGIKPGSLRLGAVEGFGNKRIVTIVCSACHVNERVVATSDLFHVSRCEGCSKAAKKAARKAKKQAKTN
jgi:hypothetical protein